MKKGSGFSMNGRGITSFSSLPSSCPCPRPSARIYHMPYDAPPMGAFPGTEGATSSVIKSICQNFKIEANRSHLRSPEPLEK
jgi:hypothetical protein